MTKKMKLIFKISCKYSKLIFTNKMTSLYCQTKVKIRQKISQLSKKYFKDAQIGRATYSKAFYILKKEVGLAILNKNHSNTLQFFNL